MVNAIEMRNLIKELVKNNKFEQIKTNDCPNGGDACNCNCSCMGRYFKNKFQRGQNY